MAISSLRLQNYRSYKDAEFSFSDGINIIVGRNAAGKTNILESITVLAEGSSFKSKDINLVLKGADWARVDGIFGDHRRTLKLKLENPGSFKTIDLDDKTYKRLSYEKKLPLVIFEPNHLQLFIRGPQQRREYMDQLLQKSQQDMQAVINKYQRVLAQRNSLLKKAHLQTKQQLFVWDLRLSELGAQIALGRKRLVDDINKSLSDKYSFIAKKKYEARANYSHQFPVENYASNMFSKLQKEVQADIFKGFTSYGPHREDFIFILENEDLGDVASRGETRSFMLALKLYEIELVEKVRGSKPIMLLDDVFSELDEKRQEALVSGIKNLQVIITTTDLNSIRAKTIEKTKVIKIKK